MRLQRFVQYPVALACDDEPHFIGLVANDPGRVEQHIVGLRSPDVADRPDHQRISRESEFAT